MRTEDRKRGHTHTSKQTDMQTCRQIGDGHTERLAERRTDRHTVRLTNKWTDRHNSCINYKFNPFLKLLSGKLGLKTRSKVKSKR